MPGFIFDGDRNVDSLPDYDEGYNITDFNLLKTVVRDSLVTQEAGEINAVTIVDSNTETEDVVGLIQGTGATGQRVSFIVNETLFLSFIKW